MSDILRFWLALQLFGLAALPLSWSLFSALPDRGYVFARVVGMLGVGYVLWLGASLGWLRNTVGGVLLAVLIVLAVGAWLGRSGLRQDEHGERPLFVHLRQQWRYILAVEVFFLLALALWAVFRSYNPEIAGTEKPMEFAFLNGILNSPQFPPRDPWLSGFGISYYYFGYVQLAALVQIAGVAPAVAFNLGLASIFALTLTSAFGLVFNLTAGDADAPASLRRAFAFGLLGALFVGLLGNLVGLLEVLHARGLTSPGLLAVFDVKDLASAPVTGSWNPGSGYWWWWRASRVIHDYSFAGQIDQEVISEFPAFSFLLGDMHPHVLGLPFVLLALALALTLFRRTSSAIENAGGMLRSAWARVTNAFGLEGWGWVLYAFALGALGFLNTWDFPIYVFVVLLAYALRRGLDGARLDRRLALEVALAGVSLFAVGIIAYLPFYIGFSSQANGIWPNFYNPTRLTQYLLMFGPFLAAAILLIAGVYRTAKVPVRAAGRWAMAMLLLPALFLGVALLAASLAPGIRQQVEQAFGIAAGQAVTRVLKLRLLTPGTWLFVGGLLAAMGALLGSVWNASSTRLSRTLIFVLALFFTGLLLTFGVEFVYLRDTFGTRMNTVFKLYYQGWILLAIASAYALYYLSTRAGRVLRAASWVVMAAFVLGGLLYPVFAIPSKANNFQGEPTLDGARFVAQYRPDEAKVIAWIQQNAPPDAVILEATGGSYSDYDTISAHTGRATLLGWGGHELQWRGSYDEPGRREPLIETVYKNQGDDRVRQIVQEFSIDYLIVGPREIDKYKIAPNRLAAFDKLWQPVFQDGSYIVYRWRG